MAASLQAGEVFRTPGCKFSYFSAGAVFMAMFIDPTRNLTMLIISNTAPAGVNVVYVAAIRDAIYACLKAD
ncbi:MAG: hypothetical protein MO846_12325 [Candidatus Devosia symbiotica]|nr:hypothetical protein [Candidatus Devosia symbiotica]